MLILTRQSAGSQEGICSFFVELIFFVPLLVNLGCACADDPRYGTDNTLHHMGLFLK